MAKSRKPQDPFVQTVVARLTPLGEVWARPMFGGYGLYADGFFFGLIARNRLYFKADEANRGAFEARGFGRFRPFADRPQVLLGYYEIPLEVFDGPDVIEWAAAALGAARRAKAASLPR